MKNSEVTVSICIPAYNSEKYISEALDSVLRQTFPNIEIIVVNDGSIDRTANILKKYKSELIKVLHVDNGGAARARNIAFKNSKGEYIKFFDADDIMSSNMIERQMEMLDGAKNKIASAEWGRFYNDDISTFKLNKEPVWKNMTQIDWLVESLWEGPNMMQPGIFLIPRKIIDKAGLWDERLSLIDDFEFMIRVILAAEEIKFTEGVKLYYRSGISNGSLSQSKSRKAMESAWLSNDLGCKYILNFENSERTRTICVDSYQLWAYNFYPEFPDLTKKAEKKVKELGGSNYKLPSGKKLALLRKFLGWKNAKKIQTYLHKK